MSTPVTKPTVKRGSGKEAERVKKRLEGFDLKNSRGMELLMEKFSKTVTNSELKSVANLLCKHIPGLKIDRDAVRDNRVLIKWFDENVDRIRPFMHLVHLRDAEYRIVDGYTDKPEELANM